MDFRLVGSITDQETIAVGPNIREVRRLRRVYGKGGGGSGGVARSSCVRSIDESGEDYVYPAECFVPVELSPAAASALRKLE